MTITFLMTNLTNDYNLSFGNSTPVVFSVTDSISKRSQSPSYARAVLSTGMGTVRQVDKKGSVF